MTTTITAQTCSACSGKLVALGLTGVSPIARCSSCGGLHTLRPVYKGALPINLFQMQTGPRPDWALCYFDLQWLDGATGELHRSHGWYDPDTLNVVQYG